MSFDSDTKSESMENIIELSLDDYTDFSDSESSNATSDEDDADDWLNAQDPNRKHFEHTFDTFQEHHGVKDEYFTALSDGSIAEFYKVFVNNEIIQLIVE